MFQLNELLIFGAFGRKKDLYCNCFPIYIYGYIIYFYINKQIFNILSLIINKNNLFTLFYVNYIERKANPFPKKGLICKL